MGERTLVVETRERPGAPNCRHHWIIDTPQGAISPGVCKYCGAEREFHNIAPDAMWESDSTSDLTGGRWARSRAVRSDDEEELTLAPKEALGEVALVL